MSNIPEALQYSESHEWLLMEGKKVRIGITDHAQEELSDIVFVDLPELGKEIDKGETLAVVESVKVASDIFSPVKGKVISVNEGLNDAPELVNSDPYGEGWIVELEVENFSSDGLLDAEEYKNLIE